MASRAHPVLPCLDAVEPERPPPALVTELLEEIFLRVASPADLARASAACVSFRRIIADHSFLRRHRSTHPPLLLGFVSSSGFDHVEAPHPSAAVARAVARAADFSFDYLPRPTTATEYYRWRPCDVRNGRVLVGCQSGKVQSGKGPTYRGLAVSDPLSRRYLLLPPITDDLLASVELQNQNMFHPGASFIPSGGPSGSIEEDTSFSVIFWMQSDTRLGVFVFSSVSCCWSVSTSTNRDNLGLNKIDVLDSGHFAYGCFYWKLDGMSMLIKLDMHTMQFCTVDLPPGHNEQQIVIVESGDSKIAMFSLNCKGTSIKCYTFSQNGSENSREWHMMSIIPLPADYCYFSHWFKGSAEGYIFLQGIPIEHHHPVISLLEIKSFRIERVSTARCTFWGHPYFGFPPSMSPIRIQGYGEVPVLIRSIGVDGVFLYQTIFFLTNMLLVALG